MGILSVLVSLLIGGVAIGSTREETPIPEAWWSSTYPCARTIISETRVSKNPILFSSARVVPSNPERTRFYVSATVNHSARFHGMRFVRGQAGDVLFFPVRPGRYRATILPISKEAYRAFLDPLGLEIVKATEADSTMWPTDIIWKRVRHRPLMIREVEIGEAHAREYPVLAYAQVAFEGEVVVRSLRVIARRPPNIFVSFPQERNREGGFVDLFEPLDSATEHLVVDAVKTAYWHLTRTPLAPGELLRMGGQSGLQIVESAPPERD